MNCADLFVRCLEQEGVQYVFAVPGEENLDMLESLRESSIRLVLTRHEQGAGFMAATYGRLTGKAGVCLSTLGPGATNLVTAAAYAQLGAMPMLMITGQKPVKSSKQGRFQIVDVVDMMAPLTKYTDQIVSADNVPSRVREAFRLAEEERPGAVHLELPEDVAAEAAEGEPIPASAVRRSIAEDKGVARAIGLMERARRPLLLIGAGANRKLTSKMLGEFAERFGIPFVTTQMGKGVIDERHRLYVGNTSLSANDFVHRAIERADLIINAGHDVVEKPPFFMESGGAEVVHVNFRPAQVDPVYFPQVEVVGDIAHSFWRFSEEMRPQPHWDFSDFATVKARLDAHLLQRADDDGFPVAPQRLVRDVRAVMHDEDVIALDNGVYKIWFSRNYRAHAPNTVLLDNALATMGAGLPSAMCAALVNPSKRVMAICGDGGFMMNSQEMETAVRMNLNVVVLLVRDDAYGMIKWKQASMGLPGWGLDFGNPDFVKYADAYRASGHRVDSAEALEPLLRRCHEAGGVHLIDCPVNYGDNDRVLNNEIRELSARLTF